MWRSLSALALAAALAAACSHSDVPVNPDAGGFLADNQEVQGVRYRAETAVLESFPVQVATTVTVTNIGSRTEEIVFSNGCPVLLRAYRTADRAGEPAWGQARVVLCTMALVPLALGPGEARQLKVQASASEILGESLPDGRYYLTAVLHPNGSTIELNAGAVDLAR